MKKTIIYLLTSMLIILFMMIIGLIIGAYIGGNYFTEFEFGSVRGYEATGNIGLLVGFVIAIVICISIGRYVYRKK